GVEQLRAVRLNESAELAVEAALAYLGVNLLTEPAPAVQSAVAAELFGALDRSIDGHPRHDFRICEMLRTTADLPHPLVRPLPDRGEMLHERLLQAPRIKAARQTGTPALMQGVHDLPENVELELRKCRVPDAHRFRGLITGQPLDLPLAQHALAAEA